MTARRRAFTLLEVLLSAVLLLYAVYVLFSIYTVTARYEVHSENRVLAALIGGNLLEESEGHLFGRTPPDDWNLSPRKLTGDWFEVTIPVTISGRPVQAVFQVQISLKTGALIGQAPAQSDPTWDVFTAVISWKEGAGARDTTGAFGQAYYKDDNQHLVVQNPVWY